MEFRNPKPTVDVIIETPGGIVFIERTNPPYGWALPGGFVDEGERVEDAARREAKEETGLEVRLETLLYVYSDPNRDPRQHTLTVVFIGRATGTPTAGDDAKNAQVFPPDQLPEPLVFDHQEIVDDYLRFRQTGERPRPERN